MKVILFLGLSVSMFGDCICVDVEKCVSSYVVHEEAGRDEDGKRKRCCCWVCGGL